MATASEKSRELLKQHFDGLQKDIAERRAELNPLREKRDAIVAKMQPHEDEARELAKQIKELSPPLAELEMELSALAKALGGRRMSEPE